MALCDEDTKNAVEFTWKWGEEERPIVEQHIYIYVGVKISECHWDWDVHMNQVIETGQAQRAKMDVIDRH